MMSREQILKELEPLVEAWDVDEELIDYAYWANEIVTKIFAAEGEL